MKKIWIAMILALALASCAGAAPSKAEAKKLLIVASLFPQYDFARQIAGDRAEVVMLLPPGAESHAFDPRPGDIRTLNKADLFIYTGEAMEPWAQRILDGLDNKNLLSVDTSRGIELHRTEEEDHDHEDSHKGHGHEGEYDPHIWLDPTFAIKMMNTIADALCARDPSSAETYRANAAKYGAEIKRLDDDFSQALREAKNGKRDTLAFGGHFAYFYFLDHYGLNYVAASDSVSTEGEPGVRRIAEIIRVMREKGIRFIFYDPQESAKVARTIADEAGAELLPFNTLHNVSGSEFESGVTYRELFADNIRRVMTALGIGHDRVKL